ncbi:unnamed protein product [Brachionus calyciflorus]|uniref:Lipoprotein n=1 Tax=Brachionus calyciflorus TaxID=104777 RepID=A0A814D8H2_9BILA|nr:unnamed protein product [Brachionus calyciflorus]
MNKVQRISIILLSLIVVLSLCHSKEVKEEEENKERITTESLPAICQVSFYDSVLRCDGGKIECSTTRNFTGEGTQNYRDFAISFVPNQENVELAELVKFYLYPRIEQDYYQNFTIQIGFKFHRFSIYYSQGMFDDGFRINNLTCYTQVVDYFRSKQQDQSVKIRTDESAVQNVTVFGFLSLV